MSEELVARLDPQIAALLQDPAGAASDGPPDLEALRVGYAETAKRLGGPPEDVAHVQNLRVPSQDGPDSEGIRARYYLPQDFADGPAGVLVWFHGGGWLIGDLAGIDPACRAICAASGHAVLSIDYRLAPEHPFPGGLADAWSAVRWAAGPDGAEMLAIEEGRVVVGGDSAGGNLAAVCARRARDTGLALRGQLLAYPALDPTRSTPAAREFADAPFLTAADMELFWNAYVAGDAAARADEPDLSPLAGTHEGLAPAYVGLAEIDPLAGDGAAYADALRRAGVAVELETYPGTAHGFLRWGGVSDRSQDLLRTLGARAAAFLA